MVDAVLKIETIDYENTFAGLFPALLKKSMDMQSRHILIRLFCIMGEDAMPILLGFMGMLSKDGKNEFLCDCVRAYSQELGTMLNDFLRKDEWGKNFKISGLSLNIQDGKMFLSFYGIDVDYESLLDKEIIQKQISNAAGKKFGVLGELAARNAGSVLKTAVRIAPGHTENKVLEFLRQDTNNEKLMKLIQEALYEQKFYITLNHIIFEKAEERTKMVEQKGTSLHISDSLEDEILHALADYLRILTRGSHL